MSSPPPLDESLYFIGDEEKEFFKSVTRINDDEELKKHLCKVQAEAYSVRVKVLNSNIYARAQHTIAKPVFVLTSTLRFQFCHYPGYKQVLKLGKERPGAIYLEIGCALGTDLRKLVADGYPLENVIACDILGEYYDLGHKLFNTTPETYPLAFIPGDIFDSSVFDPNKHPESLTEPLPPLQSLTSFTPLHSRVSVIYISAVFHLFSPEKQQKLAHILASMLSPLPGSIILGTQSSTDSGIHGLKLGNDSTYAWYYSVSAWKDLWMGVDAPFKAEEVDAQVIEQGLAPEVVKLLGLSRNPQFLVWSITRI